MNTFTSNRLLRMQTPDEPMPMQSMKLINKSSNTTVTSASSADYNNDAFVENLPAGEYILQVHFAFSKGNGDLSKLRSVVGVWGDEIRLILAKQE